MKILFVNSLYAPDIGGGAELQLAKRVEAARRSGHEVLVVTTTGGGEVVHDVINGVPAQRVPIRNVYWHHGAGRRSAAQRLLWHAFDANNSAMAEQLLAVARLFRPDVMVFHNLAGWSAAVWQVAQRLDVPAIQVLHDYYNLCPRSLMLRDDKPCQTICSPCKVFRSRRADASNGLSAVIGVSAAVLEPHVRFGLFSDVPIRRVIYNARKMAAPQARAIYASDTTGARRFGFIGTVAPWKGLGTLLDAFEGLTQRLPHPDLRLLIAGTGEPRYVAELKTRYAGTQIEFLGKVDPESFFSQLDVSVVPSLWNDPLPGVVFESLMSGVPTIGARRGGIPEMVTHEDNGLLFDPDSAGSLEQALHRMATTPQLLAHCRRRAVPSSSLFTDMDRVASEYEEVYQSVLRTGRPQASAAIA